MKTIIYNNNNNSNSGISSNNNDKKKNNTYNKTHYWQRFASNTMLPSCGENINIKLHQAQVISRSHVLMISQNLTEHVYLFKCFCVSLA